MVAAARTPPGKARPTIALTAPARHTMKAGARPTRTPMAAKRRANIVRTKAATHTNTYGGTTSAQYGQGATHTNVYGGTTSAAYGEGAYHTGAYGYGTAYHPPTAYYGYHPPATVNYYGSTCANCNGWAAAAAVTTAAVTGAAVASANANAANANAAAASANAYNAGYNAGTTTSQPATTTTTVVATPGNYSMGQMVGALPAGCITPTVQGTTYYLCGNTWFSAAYGANGVYYRVVPGPGG